jgi:coenzyme F420-reducing hydrogenase delta subunit
VSASEGDKWAAVVKTMVEDLKKLGPSQVRALEAEAE